MENYDTLLGLRNRSRIEEIFRTIPSTTPFSLRISCLILRIDCTIFNVKHFESNKNYMIIITLLNE